MHWEAFAAAEPGQPFRVELARSGQQLEVAADESLLEAHQQPDALRLAWLRQPDPARPLTRRRHP